MKIKFWGVRGSIPTPISSGSIRQKIEKVLKKAKNVDLDDSEAVKTFLDSLPMSLVGTLGGNSSCVELRTGNRLLVFDAGSGIRELGLSLMKTEFGKGAGTVDIFISHTHWDHLMGFPFFIPAYVPGNKINFYGCHPELKRRISEQQHSDHFPIQIDMMASEKNFCELKPGSPHDIGDGITVTPFTMSHPGGSFGYRVEREGKVFVYASDTEMKNTKAEDTVYLRNADLLVLDTMYTFDDLMDKTSGWGHCTPPIGVDISLTEKVKKLFLFHHEPLYSDEQMEKVLSRTIYYKKSMDRDSELEIHLSCEGEEFEI